MLLVKAPFRPKIKRVTQTEAIPAAGAYAAGDVISMATSTGVAWEWNGVARANGASGYIVQAQVICETTALTHRASLFLFNAAPTCETDDNKANTALLHADIASYVGKIDFPALGDVGTGDSEALATPSTVGNLPMVFVTASGADDLYGILTTIDTIDGQAATEEYTVTLWVEQY